MGRPIESRSGEPLPPNGRLIPVGIPSLLSASDSFFKTPDSPFLESEKVLTLLETRNKGLLALLGMYADRHLAEEHPYMKPQRKRLFNIGAALVVKSFYDHAEDQVPVFVDESDVQEAFESDLESVSLVSMINGLDPKNFSTIARVRFNQLADVPDDEGEYAKLLLSQRFRDSDSLVGAMAAYFTVRDTYLNDNKRERLRDKQILAEMEQGTVDDIFKALTAGVATTPTSDVEKTFLDSPPEGPIDIFDPTIIELYKRGGRGQTGQGGQQDAA